MDHLRQLSEVHHPAPQNGDPYGKGVRLLPPGCKVGRLVGEGAANAVFELVLPDGSYLYHQTSRSLTHLSLADMRCAATLLGPFFQYEPNAIATPSAFSIVPDLTLHLLH